MSRTSRRSRIVTAVITTLLGIVALEGGHRLYLGWRHQRHLDRIRNPEPTGWVETDSLGDIVQLSPEPDVIYVLKPNLSGRYRGGEFRVNAASMRGDHLPALEPQPGVARIVGLGDSFMFAQGVDQAEGYMEQLGARLAAQGIENEVLNFAVPGYNTVMEAAVLETTAAAYSPTVIVVGVTGNDWDLPDFLYGQPPIQPLGSVVLASFWEALGRPGDLEHTPISTYQNGRFLFHVAEVPAPYRHMVGYAGFYSGLRRIRDAAGGAKVILFTDCFTEIGGGIFAFEPGQRDALATELEGWGFQICPWRLHRTEMLAGDWHPNVEGHRKLAQLLVGCLTEGGVLPGAAAP